MDDRHQQLDWYNKQIEEKRPELNKLRAQFLELDQYIQGLERERAAIFRDIMNYAPKTAQPSAEGDPK